MVTFKYSQGSGAAGTPVPAGSADGPAKTKGTVDASAASAADVANGRLPAPPSDAGRDNSSHKSIDTIKTGDLRGVVLTFATMAASKQYHLSG